ncbi:MAG: hypothetical protein ACOCUZ_02180 [bacterium]
MSSRATASRAAAAVVLACALLTACETEPDAAPVSQLEDAPVAIDPTPSTRLGTVEAGGPQEFHDVEAPSFTSDGFIVVPLRGENEIRIFDRQGQSKEVLGGPGDGPGEFRFLAGVWTHGDTLEAWDMDHSRITRFPPDGDVETILLGDEILEGSGVLSSAVARTQEGWMVNSVVWPGFGHRDRVLVHHFARDGSLIGRGVLEVPGMMRIRTPRWSGPSPLSPSARFAWADTDDGGVLVAGETLEASLTLMPLDGRPTRTIEWEPPRRWDPEDAFQRAVEVDSEGREEPFRQREGHFYDPEWPSETDSPDAVPVFADLLVDELGFIWVLPFDPTHHAAALGGNVGDGRAAPGGRWVVLSQEGERVAEIEVPDGLEPYQVTEDEVLGIYRDELGVEFVAAHPLERH